MEAKGNLDFGSDNTAQIILAAIRTNYLEARSPQQIQELVNLFSIAKTSVPASIHTTTTTDLSTSSERSEGNPGSSAKVQGDLGKLGIMTEREKFCSPKMGGNTLEEVTPGTNNTTVGEEETTTTDSSLLVMQKLHSVTVGYSPEEAGGGDEAQENLLQLQPPAQYRIAFVKHVIKQMEFSGKWSAPQGGHEEEDIEDPAEQKALLLENWYDTLEQLSSTGQVLSEPFYRLYEIKLPANHNKGESRQEIVKIFENESSFVADGTTGLVTWKAAIEFAKWLSSSANDGGGESKAGMQGGAFENCKWILELGCGCGFLAVVVTKLLKALEQYIATDGSLAALEKAKENVEANFTPHKNDDDLLKSKIRFERVDWQNDSTKEAFTQLVDGMTGIYGAERGVLLGTDIIFDPSLIPDLVEIINEFLERKSGTVFLACTIRNPETIQKLRSELDLMALKLFVRGRWEDGEIMEITQ